MDDKDRYILAELKQNARLSTAALAKSLKVSRATVQNRIDRMIDGHVIKRFTIETGEGAEIALIEALVLLKTGSGDDRPLIAKLKKLDDVHSLTSLNGNYDFALELSAKSAAQLDATLEVIRRMDHVAETTCSIRLQRFA
ncbi:Lrp/AsnC family transcriptional regulator [Rhizobium leguminosarum]|uniref:HTH asnC-type domain-containing protein n=1 Tax=Rhizobium leguminosarum TaxID=384 RepID=A0A1B1CKH1_RHILE|nr:Lrp/AsnC family transcriptional regulator [Rhizobium leguminosarum]ANP90221.1 hypothetical protein BA011_40630 [Rhizobium leguminosarum]